MEATARPSRFLCVRHKFECYFSVGDRSEGAGLLRGPVRLLADGDEPDWIQGRRAD